MKKLVVIIGLFFFFAHGFAQPPKWKSEDFEKFKAMKISFMTEKLELTPLEAQRFWPIYNEFEKKRFELNEKGHNLEKQIRDHYDSYSESDFRKLSYELVDQEVQEANLSKVYNDKFLQVLPAKKVVMIGQFENEFRFRMIREFRDKEQGKDSSDNRP